MSKVNHSAVFGAFERVTFPQLGIDDAIAKVDTGAYSGALHCARIKEVKRKSDGKKILQITPEDKGKVVEIEEWQTVKVRSSMGHQAKRYLITTEMVVSGKKYNTVIGLSDRSKMQFKVLIGRRFLRENDIMVDTRVNQEYDKDSGEQNV